MINKFNAPITAIKNSFYQIIIEIRNSIATIIRLINFTIFKKPLCNNANKIIRSEGIECISIVVLVEKCFFIAIEMFQF